MNLDRRQQLDEIAERLAPYQDKIVLAEDTDCVATVRLVTRSYLNTLVQGEVLGEYKRTYGSMFQLSYFPIRVATLVIYCAGCRVADDGNGGFCGDKSSSNNNFINYDTGQGWVTFSPQLLARSFHKRVLVATYEFCSP